MATEKIYNLHLNNSKKGAHLNDRRRRYNSMIRHGSTATAGSRKLKKEKFVMMQKKTCKPECKIIKKGGEKKL